MARFSSLGGLLRRAHGSRDVAAGTEVSGDQTARADEAAETAAETTERIRRVVQGARLQPAETDAPPAPPRPAAPAAARPAAPPGPVEETQLLWGKAFTLTERGLSEEQVVAFVEDLLSRNKALEEQSSPVVMSRYVEKLMGELQVVEETVRAQATRDAELEAAKITAEARRAAQEEITRARSEAAVQAQQHADAILSEARKKAEIAEGQVRIQAQLMLGKARDQVQEHIRKEGELAFNRVMASLSTLVQEAQYVESEWKQQTARLWQGAETALSTSANLSAFPIVRETLDSSRGPAPAAPARQEPVEAPPPWPVDQSPSDEAVVAETTVPQEPVEPEPLDSEEVERAEGVVDTEARAEVAPEAEEAVTVPDEEEGAEPAEEDAAGEATDTAEPPPEVEIDDAAKRALYAGEIELSLAPPVDPSLLARLYSRLLAMADLRILRTKGSLDSGTTINLLLERPQPLISRLLEIPEVRITPEQIARPSMGSGGDPGDRIAIALRE